MSGAYKGIGVMVGAVVFLLGLAMIFGAVPSRIICSPGCGQESVVSDFAVTSSGLNVSLHDASCVLENGARLCYRVTSITVAWGDGARSNGSVGGTLAHAYAAAGTYRVTDTAYAKGATGGTISGAMSQSITVPSSGSGTASYTLDPLLSWTQVGFSVTVRDTSVVANVTGYSDAIAWGDGTRTTLNATGATASHTYSLSPTVSNATFTVTQTDTGTSPTGSQVQASAVYAVTVSGNNSTSSSSGGCSATNTCPPPPPTGSPPPYTLNAVSLAATVGGLLLVVAVVAPGDIRPRVLLFGVGVLVALLAGYEVGGW